MRFCLLLADVDNTLFDFHSAERAAFAAVSARFALPGDSASFALYQEINKTLWQMLDRGETNSFRLRVDRFSMFLDALRLPTGNAKKMSDYYVLKLGEQCLPMPGARAFLRRVSAAMPVCLVTNGFADVQRPRVRGSTLQKYIDRMYISEEYPHPKPHPEMLLRAMKRYRVDDPKRVVMIGDNEDADILAAVNAGTQSVLYTRGRAPGAPSRATFTADTLAAAADWILRP